MTVHEGRSYPYRLSWFVVFNPPPDACSDRHAALVALEDEPNVWDGFRTFRPALVDRIDRHVSTAF
ncbi:sensor protein [Halorubrum lipolyticum DSM 21995]|uniref:Sensor protein n=1 Tax=Halorubrum lipolyticum DSM 21995 TaxID=1227482 RepID=M0NPI5_9EURY|nr:sensor protein [Halorubrum lipolyticum DSM 21995]